MRRMTYRTPAFSRHRQRASVLVIVLMLLALMTVFVSVWAYLSRLEAHASRNVGKTVQNRMAVATGLPTALAILYPKADAVASGLVSAHIPSPSGSRRDDTKSDSDDDDDAPARPSPLVRLTMVDQSGLININALLPADSGRKAALGDGETFVLGENSDAFELPSRAVWEPETLISNDISDETPSTDPLWLPPEILENLLASVTGKSRDGSSRATRLAKAIVDLRDERLEASDRTRQTRRSPTPVPVSDTVSGRVARPSGVRRGVSSVSASRRQASGPAGRVATMGGNPGSSSSNGPSEPTEGNGLPIHRLKEIAGVDGMDEETLEAISPYLTVYSTTLEAWGDADANRYVRLPINRLSASDIVKVLRVAYPEAADDTLVQFAVNVVDRRDIDSIPTSLVPVAGGDPILGFELGPIVSEVCPDVITFESDGDNGEYFEIYNPLETTLDLRGWRVDWGSGACFLNVTLAPRGFVVVTDDIDNSNDPTPEDDSPGMGSFYDVFRMLPSGASRILVEQRGMDIPNDSGRIALYDNMGNLIDYLTYDKAKFNGDHRGFHRTSFFNRDGVAGAPSPFETDLDVPQEGYARACWTVLTEYMDTPFQSVGELLAVPVDAVWEGDTVEWRFPALTTSDNVRLDLRLLDCFVAGDPADALREAADLIDTEGLEPWTAGATWPGRDRLAVGLEAPKEGELAERIGPWQALSAARDPLSFGKINVNTAPSQVLVALPGFTVALAEAVEGAQGAAGEQDAEGQDGSDSDTPDVAVSRVANASPRGLPSGRVAWQEKTQGTRVQRMAPPSAARTVQTSKVPKVSTSDDETRQEASSVPYSEADATFSSIGGFAASKAVWGDWDPADRLARLIALCPYITVNSTSYAFQAVPFRGAAEEPTSPLESRGLVRIHEGGMDVVQWSCRRPIAEKASEEATEGRTPWEEARANAKSGKRGSKGGSGG